MNEQISMFPGARESDKRSCYICKTFAELKRPYERSDGAVIYGYCFKAGDKDYSPNMGKGYPVFIDGGSCQAWKKRKEAELTMNKPKLERCPHCEGNGRVHRQYYHPTRVISTRFDGQFTQALPTERIGFAVECEKCLSVGGVAETKEEAVRLWNRRAPLPDNKALTVEELREMDGEPVWCEENECWALVCLYIDTLFLRFNDGSDITTHVASQYTLYRRPPEKGE